MKARLGQKYGHQVASLGSESIQLDVIPTGSLALDYALGTGGWPRRSVIEIFGQPDIGKSSVLGMNAIRNADEQGLLPALIALEPHVDAEWIAKNGVDPEKLVIIRPDNGEEAFALLYDCVAGPNHADLVVFDSIGAVLSSSETAEDGKAKQGGQSGLITWGTKRILMPAWKNNVCVIMLNQQRDDMKARIPGQVESPGGWALKHSASIRVHLKFGRERYTEKIDGDDVVVGRQLVAVMKRNKHSEGSNKKATFDYYQMETEEMNVGIDATADVLATGIRTGVIQKAGAWYKHPSFPDPGRLQGKNGVATFLADHPEAVKQIRQEVLGVMLVKQGEVKEVKPDLKAVDGGKEE